MQAFELRMVRWQIAIGSGLILVVAVHPAMNSVKVPINVSALPDARSARNERGRGVLRAFGKAVSTWPPVGAVDAGPMQIQLREGVGLRCAETVLSGATQDAARPESWLGGKSIAQAVVEGAGRKNLFGRQTEK